MFRNCLRNVISEQNTGGLEVLGAASPCLTIPGVGGALSH